PINLDNVIYYCPSTKKLYFKLFGVPGSYDLLAFESSILGVYAIPLNKVEILLAPNELTEEVTINSSNKFNIDFLNTSSERDINVTILNIYTASRELPDNISSSNLGYYLGGGLKQSIPLYSISVRNSLYIPVAEEEILSRIELARLPSPPAYVVEYRRSYDRGRYFIIFEPDNRYSRRQYNERGTKDTVLIVRIASSNRKRDRLKYISNNSSDNPNSLDDTDYIGESGKDVYRNSVPFYRLKRVRRPTV
ncbi:hypothetical protein N7449_005097, partial [Penicillium cf. viridicatum]